MRINFALLAVFGLMAAIVANQTFVYEGQLNGSGGRGDIEFKFRHPYAIEFGSDGLVYVGDTFIGSIVGLNSSDHVVRTIGGITGPSKFTDIMEIEEYRGNILISDGSSNQIFEYIHGSGIFTYGPDRGLLFNPTSFWIENNTMWVLNSQTGKIIEYDLDRNYLIVRHLESGIGSGKLNAPKDFTFDERYVYVADSSNDRVQVFDREFNFVSTIGTGTGGVALTQPKAVAVDRDGRIFVSDGAKDRIIVFDINGNVLEVFGTTGSGEGEFRSPGKMKFDKNGVLYIVDSGNNRVVYYTLDWGANILSSVREVDEYNQTISEYKRDVIDVMDSLKINYSPFVAFADMQKAYELISEQKYGDAKTIAKKAVEKVEQRRQIDKQLLDVKLTSVYGNISFAIDYYSGLELSLENEKVLSEVKEKYDKSRDAFRRGEYASSAATSIEIEKQIDEIENARMQQMQTQKENTTVQVEPNQKILIDSRAANLQIEMEKLQKRADEAYIFANFETVRILIETSKELAKVGVYTEAQTSLDNSQEKLGEIETSVVQKEKQIESAKAEIEAAYTRLADMGITRDSGSQAILELKAAEEMALDDPSKVNGMIEGAIEQANLESAKGIEFGYALAAVGGAFAAVVVIGAGAVFYIMRRSKKIQDGLGEVKVEFAKTKEEIRTWKKQKRKR